MYGVGYYFNPSAAATAEFTSVFPEIVEKSYEMGMGDYVMVECSIGVCFIYRYAVEMGSYSDTQNPFFSDFYLDAADYLLRYGGELAMVYKTERLAELLYEATARKLIPKRLRLVHAHAEAAPSMASVRIVFTCSASSAGHSAMSSSCTCSSSRCGGIRILTAQAVE